MRRLVLFCGLGCLSLGCLVRLGGQVRMRRLISLLVVSLTMLGAGAATALTALSAASRCPNVMSKFDAAGDVRSGIGGADITAVRVGCTSSVVWFRVTFAMRPPLLPSDELLIIMDVPPAGSSSPFSKGFPDYDLDVRGPQKVGMGSRVKPASSWTFPVHTAGRTVGFSVDRSKLGNPASFRFIVATHRWQGDAVMAYVDTAPDRGGGTYFYVFPR